MKLDEIHNVAVFFSMGGKTLALRMTPEQKKS
ncbi:Uncharacterised protein [Pseudescherichia vulneris]|nr:Uncharacterised protein [Pseudescherichia vulneris]